MRNRERGFWLAVAGASVAGAGLAVGLTVAFSGGSSAPPSEATAQRSYTDVQACLLTGSKGLADPAAAPVWAGMQQASKATHAEVSYLAVTGAQTEDNALPYLGSLLARHCAVVLAAGQPERAAIADRARQFPSVTFAVVGGTSTAPNVTVLSGDAAAIQGAVASAVSRASGG